MAGQTHDPVQIASLAAYIKTFRADGTKRNDWAQPAGVKIKKGREIPQSFAQSVEMAEAWLTSAFSLLIFRRKSVLSY